MTSKHLIPVVILLTTMIRISFGQINDVNTPLHLMKPDYPVPYNAPAETQIKEVLDRVYNYLDAVTPAKLVDKHTNLELTNFSGIDANTIMQPGDFRLNSYEWGVTYSGMLLAGRQTGDDRYTRYVIDRFNFLNKAGLACRKFEKKHPGEKHFLSNTLHPHALDDCGAIAAAMIKAVSLKGMDEMDWLIKILAGHVSEGQFRLPDGTLARNRPLDNALWLDDLYMGVPALAQMGRYTGDQKYFNDAVKQVVQFGDRMFNDEKGLFMHGWIAGMDEHPRFHWARANGWAVMAMVELLEVLPKDHPGREKVLALLRKHIRGLAGYQDGTGFWHQLIDRNDSYLETSATAIYTFCIARAVNRGYVDAKVYGPMVCLAWNALSTKVNEKGQVEGTCVGTGMGFDPAFYYYRPVNKYAAHGYGPVLLAGAEMIRLVRSLDIVINDSAVMLDKD